MRPAFGFRRRPPRNQHNSAFFLALQDEGEMQIRELDERRESAVYFDFLLLLRYPENTKK